MNQHARWKLCLFAVIASALLVCLLLNARLFGMEAKLAELRAAKEKLLKGNAQIAVPYPWIVPYTDDTEVFNRTYTVIKEE